MDGLLALPAGVYMLRAEAGVNRSLIKLVKE